MNSEQVRLHGIATHRLKIIRTSSDQVEEAEALKAIYGEDFRVISERERTVRVTIKSDDASLSLDLLVRPYY